MKNMTTFTKWFLFSALALTGIFFAYAKGALSLMIRNDVSNLTIVIMLLYVAASALVGRLCYLADKTDGNTCRDIDERGKLARQTEVGWFAAEHFFSLGLLGTVFGLCVATSTSLKEGTEISDIVSGLKVGLNTAFYTTICGIVFSLLLQIQLMILRFKLEQDD